MEPEIEERIRVLAYAIWEAEGRPDGKHLEHWLQARRLVAAEASRAMAGAMVTQSPAPQALSDGGDSDARPARLWQDGGRDHAGDHDRPDDASMANPVTTFWSELRAKLAEPWTLEEGKEAAEMLLDKFLVEMDRRPDSAQARRDGIVRFLTDVGQQPTIGFDSVPEIELQKHVETLADAYLEHWRRKPVE